MAVHLTHQACATVLVPVCYQVMSRLARRCRLPVPADVRQSMLRRTASAAPRRDAVLVKSVEKRGNLDRVRTRLDASGTPSSPHTEDDTGPVTVQHSMYFRFFFNHQNFPVLLQVKKEPKK